MKKFFSARAILALLSTVLLLSCSGTNNPKVLRVSVPQLQNFNADGDLSEWSGIQATRLYSNALGEYPEPADLEAWLKTAWNSNGLLISLDITDDVVTTNSVAPWTADAVELFLSPFRGSDDIIQLSFVAALDSSGQPFCNINDFRETPELQKVDIKSDITASFIRKEGHTRWEIMVNPGCIGIDPEAGNQIAAQVYVDDADSKDNTKKNQLLWYNLGNSYLNSFAMYDVTFTASESTVIEGTSDLVITDNDEAGMRIFGAVSGDNIRIDRNGMKFFEAKAKSDVKWKPDTFDFSHNDLDFEHDSLMVFINNKPVGFHDLYISPRRYVKAERMPFDVEIRNFVMKDRLNFPPAGATLFIGSSSIRKWNTVQNDFPDLKVIHRGFGGSTSEEALMYMDKIVLPYKPAQIVYYEGDNDVPRGFSAEKIRDNVKAFIDRALEQNPDTKIYILSPKPCIARRKLWDKYLAAHVQLRTLADAYPNVKYVDVSSAMFDKKGKLKEEIFVADGVHMNEDGYKIWTAVIRDALGLDQR